MARIRHVAFRLAAALVLLVAFGAACAAAPPHMVTTIDRAEYVASNGKRPPDDGAPWRPVALPDNWNASRAGFSGQLWYRLSFHPADGPLRTHVLFLPRNSAAEMAFFVNGLPLGMNVSYGDPRLSELQRPMVLTVPAVMLRDGKNVLHMRVTGDADYRHGLPRVSIGFGPEVRAKFYEPRFEQQVTSIAVFGAALLVAGLLALFVWRGEGRDSVLLWYGLTALTGAFSAYLLLWPPKIDQESLRHLLNFFVRHLFVTPLLVLCLRVGEVRAPRLETVLGLGFAAGCVAAVLVSSERYPIFATTASIAYLVLGIGFFGWLLRIKFQPHQWTFYFLALTFVMVIALAGHDWARWMGYVDFDNLLLAPFAAPFLILALGATVVERHLGAAQALVRANAELERRVAEKVREVEATYKKMQDALHEQAVLRERQRIMADMHDGLGANLVSLMSLVQSRKVNLNDVERHLNDTLTELRSIVDSLEPVEGDLGTVLGNVRYRMRSAIEESGAKFIWRVEPLPALDYLTPGTVLAIQRIVLEALTNALRHAGASTVTVSASHWGDQKAIVITIADDGKGFEPSAPSIGHGLRNMRNRAATIGMHIAIDSQPGQGTRVTLKLPTTKDASRAAVDTRLELAHSGSPHFPGATRNRRVS